MIKVSNLSKIYNSKEANYEAIKNLNVEFEDKGFIFLIGDSGSGKSTLLNILGTLDRDYTGKVIYNKKDLGKLSQDEIIDIRKKEIGFVFQEYNVIEKLSVEENIKIALELQNTMNLNKINHALKMIGLEGLNNRKMTELSGGQRQRVSIARALVKDSSYYLCDEPTGNLDYNSSLDVMTALKKVSKTKLVIVVTHDLELASLYADRIIEISDGKIVSDKKNKSVKLDELMYKKVLVDRDTKEIFNEANIYREENKNVEILAYKSSTKLETNKHSNKKVIPTKPPLMYSIKSSLHNIGQKKARLISVTLAMTIMLGLVMTFKSIGDYRHVDDYKGVINNSDLFSYQVASYYQFDGSDAPIYVNNTEQFSSVIANNFDEYLYEVDNIMFSYEANNELSKATHYIDTGTYKYSNLIGNMPSGANDIVLSRGLARKIFGEVNDISDYVSMTFESDCELGYCATDDLVNYGDTFTVTGIIDDRSSFFLSNTEYHDKYFNNRDLLETSWTKIRSKNNKNYTIEPSYIKQSSITNLSSLLLPGYHPLVEDSDVYVSLYAFNRLCNYSTYVDNDELVDLINSPDAEMQACLDSVIGGTYEYEYDFWLPGVSDEQYFSTYSRVFDTEVLNESVTIKGIVDTRTMDSELQNYTFIAKDSYVSNLIDSDYYKSFTNIHLIIDDNNIDEVVSGLSELDLYLTDPIMEKVNNAYRTSIDTFTDSLIFTLLFFAIVILFFIYWIYLNGIVDLNKKDIGILKSLGSTNFHIMLVYFIQSIIIGLVAILISFIYTFILLLALNPIFFSDSINVGATGYRITSGAFLLVFAATTIITILPVVVNALKFRKSEPIDIIKESK